MARPSGPGDSPRWTTENAAGAWTRNVPGTDGDLAATTTSAGDIKLQLTNLFGSVVLITDLSLTTPVLLDTDEYGTRPAGQSITRYGWLGAKQRSAEAQDGIVLMGVRLYNPTTGRFLSLDPVPGGSANPYEYASGDPVNQYDLDGRVCWFGKNKNGSCRSARGALSPSNQWNDVKNRWNETKQDWGANWKHKLVNIGVGAASAMAAGACVATVACGGALVMVGGAAIFAGGLAGHYAVSSPAERRQGVGRWAASTALAEAKGGVCGALWGRGCATGFGLGAPQKWGLKATMGGGTPPLLYNTPRAEWARSIGGWFKRVMD
ncbi:RHS repeat-associated core domain-containing protein [Kitasatospora purpeofusca]|uniref:RHS repeat-associated core domain-containing protein n=1 Tax=Kitasatospora purpeofusca TaxID=67352 RepID=UPI0035DC2888